MTSWLIAVATYGLGSQQIKKFDLNHWWQKYWEHWQLYQMWWQFLRGYIDFLLLARIPHPPPPPTPFVSLRLLYKLLFSRISRVRPSRKFPLQFMSIYSNKNILKITKLTPHELTHLVKKIMKITVRENIGVYSICYDKLHGKKWSHGCWEGLLHIKGEVQ